MSILNYLIFNIRILDWLIALGVFVIAYGILQAARQIALNRIKHLSQRVKNPWNGFAYREVSQTRPFFILALSFYVASLILPLQPIPHELIKLLMEAALLLQVAIWGTILINFLINERAQSQPDFDPAAATTMNALSLIARLALWTIILLIMLENIPGIQITSLIASLGITGIAVALAVQRILSDLLASLTIALDKPFMLGDFITVDQFQGTVESIGLRSTRLRSLDGEQLIFSNSDLLNSRIHNFKRMTRRRVQFPLQVNLKTPVEKLAGVPGIIQNSISGLDGVTFHRAHFKEIGTSSYLFEVVYYVEFPEYTLYMDKQQAINLRLLEQFHAAGIDLGPAA